MKLLYAVYEEFGKTKKLIAFTKEVEGKNSYRAGVSLQCFCDTELNTVSKLYTIIQKKNLTLKWLEDNLPRSTRIVFFEDWFKGYIEDYPDIKLITVNSVWEMYQEIGYDYKTKKYLENENVG